MEKTGFYFKAEKNIPIPTKDILSWIFDDQRYDQNKPVSILLGVQILANEPLCALLRTLVLDLSRCLESIPNDIFFARSCFDPKARGRTSSSRTHPGRLRLRPFL